MNDMIIVSILISAVVLALLLYTVNFSVLFRLPKLELIKEVELTEVRYTESVSVKNTGGRPSAEITVKIDLKICTEQSTGPTMTEIMYDARIGSIVPGEKEMVLILRSDRSGFDVGGTTVMTVGGSDHTIEWEKNKFSGNIRCLSGKIVIGRNLAIEKTEDSVHVHIFRF